MSGPGLAWMVACVALLPALAMPVFVACRGALPDRFVAAQMVSSVAMAVLVAMSFAFDQPSFVDLPLSLALLGVPGTLMLALFLERWL